MTEIGERCGGVPTALRPNWPAGEHLWSEGSPTVVTVELGEVGGSLVTATVSGAAMVHGGGELGAVAVDLELEDRFVGSRRSSRWG